MIYMKGQIFKPEIKFAYFKLTCIIFITDKIMYWGIYLDFFYYYFAIFLS